MACDSMRDAHIPLPPPPPHAQPCSHAHTHSHTRRGTRTRDVAFVHTCMLSRPLIVDMGAHAGKVRPSPVSRLASASPQAESGIIANPRRFNKQPWPWPDPPPMDPQQQVYLGAAGIAVDPVSCCPACMKSGPFPKGQHTGVLSMDFG